MRANLLEFEAEKPIVILNKEDAEELDVKPLDRIELAYRKKKMVAIVNVAERFIRPGEIGLYSLVAEKLHVKRGKRINVAPSLLPISLMYIRRKLMGRTLKSSEIKEIVQDVVNQKLSDIEMTSFVVALYNHGMTMDETAALASSMTETGQILHLGKKEIYDKHSIGGVSGDKTSMLLVPTIAAAGLTIPKTSSRAITSPAGTADRRWRHGPGRGRGCRLSRLHRLRGRGDDHVGGHASRRHGAARRRCGPAAVRWRGRHGPRCQRRGR